MKKIFRLTGIPFLPLLAGVSLALTLSFTSCSTGTDPGDTNVERGNVKTRDPNEHNQTDTTAQSQEQQPGVEHYEQTYGGAQEPPSNLDANNNDK